jgi:hypothetical protein
VVTVQPPTEKAGEGPSLPTHSPTAVCLKRVLGLLLILAAATPAWGAVAVDQVKSTNRSTSGTSITSPSFSTTAANELLLAFISTDAKSPGITVTGVTGAGLTWALVQRTNAQLGTSEIWRAFAPTALTNATATATTSQSVAASITVVTFTGADTSGAGGSGAIGATASANAASGAPSASLVTTRNASWVFGVGNDWDNAIARAVPSNQTMINQYLAAVGDTYWVQRENSTTPLSGTSVTINDTAPTSDCYNLTLVEVLPAPTSGTTFAVSGTATPASIARGASVSLNQNNTTIATATVNANGDYSFPSVANGTYTVVPVNSGVNFSPTSQSVTVNGEPATVPAFTATAQTWTMSGSITPAANGVGSTVTLTQGSTTLATTTPDAGGDYSFTGLVNGTYTVTPTATGFVFTPASLTVTINGGNQTANFTAAPATYTVSGAITPATSGSGATVTLAQGATTIATVTANSIGSYTFTGVVNGSYTVTPAANGVTFSPASQSISVGSANVTGVNFSALAALAIDVVAYGDASSASTSIATSTFSTASINELLMAFIASDASSSGMTVTGVTGGGLAWALVRRTNTQMGTAEVWSAFAPAQLSSVSVTAALAQSVVASITVVTFIGADTSGASGLGAIGATASASASTGAPNATLVTTRNGSWVFGVGDDWDNAIARTVGADQTMAHQLLSKTNDTYWVQRQNSPTPLSGTSVTINDTAPAGDCYNLTLVEVLPPVGAYGISGSLSTQGSGAAVALGGAANAVTTADISGNYTFSGLTDGTYSVTPSKSGYIFSPTDQSATINGANVAGVNFTVSATSPLPVAISISPTSALLSTRGQQQFTASLSGTSNTAVNWSTSGGTVTTSGLYTAPRTAGTYTVTATSVADTTKSASASVSVSQPGPVSISVTPTSADVQPAGQQQFIASVSGTSNTAVTWAATGGTVTTSGLYTAPGTAGTYTVTATSVADTTKSASATVTVTPTISSTVLLGDQNVENQVDSSLALGQAEAFQATANASGTLQSLALYLDSTSTVSQVVAGLYADAGGLPGSLLSQGSSTQVVAGAWNTISLSTSVVAGTPYWIAILGTNSGNLVFRDATGGGCASEISAQTSLTSLPSTWTTGTASSTCPISAFGDSTTVVFFDTFAGTTLSPYWTVISRHGEYSQDETECNVPSMVSVNNGLTITTEAQSATCGDYFTAPSSWPYITGDIQWTSLNFTYGTVEIEAKFPSVNTRLWPATWMLTTSCQYTNPLTGSTGTTIDGYNCPNIGQSGYHEIDMTECYTSSGWCQFHVANPGFGIGNGCDIEGGSYTVDTNWHLFTTVWNSSSIKQYMDGNLISTCNQKISTSMFLIIQTQTGGVGGTPNNTILPATLGVNYVKVTQP